MIPKIFHQSSKYFTWEERKLARRAQALMPEWAYHAWTDEDNLALVEKFCPAHVEKYMNFPSGGCKVDVARYLYMYQYGGIYFDTDFYFFRPIDENWLSHSCILGIEDEDCSEFEDGIKLGNAFIGSQPGLALWPELVNSIFTRFQKDEVYPYGYLSGPQALTAFLRDHQLYRESITMLPPNVVYPKLIRFNLTGARDPETIGVHFCWGTWWLDKTLPHKIKNRTRRILTGMLA